MDLSTACDESTTKVYCSPMVSLETVPLLLTNCPTQPNFDFNPPSTSSYINLTSVPIEQTDDSGQFLVDCPALPSIVTLGIVPFASQPEEGQQLLACTNTWPLPYESADVPVSSNDPTINFDARQSPSSVQSIQLLPDATAVIEPLSSCDHLMSDRVTIASAEYLPHQTPDFCQTKSSEAQLIPVTSSKHQVECSKTVDDQMSINPIEIASDTGDVSLITRKVSTASDDTLTEPWSPPTFEADESSEGLTTTIVKVVEKGEITDISSTDTLSTAVQQSILTNENTSQRAPNTSIETIESTFKCQYCQQCFSSIESLRKHQRDWHYFCTQCKLSFEHNGDWEVHQEMHRKNYICQVCKMKFIKKT